MLRVIFIVSSLCSISLPSFAEFDLLNDNPFLVLDLAPTDEWTESLRNKALAQQHHAGRIAVNRCRNESRVQECQKNIEAAYRIFSKAENFQKWRDKEKLREEAPQRNLDQHALVERQRTRVLDEFENAHRRDKLAPWSAMRRVLDEFVPQIQEIGMNRRALSIGTASVVSGFLDEAERQYSRSTAKDPSPLEWEDFYAVLSHCRALVDDSPRLRTRLIRAAHRGFEVYALEKEQFRDLYLVFLSFGLNSESTAQVDDMTTAIFERYKQTTDSEDATALLIDLVEFIAEEGNANNYRLLLEESVMDSLGNILRGLDSSSAQVAALVHVMTLEEHFSEAFRVRFFEQIRNEIVERAKLDPKFMSEVKWSKTWMRRFLRRFVLKSTCSKEVVLLMSEEIASATD